MRKFVVAVCDTEDGYRSRFVTYLMEQNAGRFAVHSFSRPGLFLEQFGEEVFDLILLGHGFEGVREEVQKRHVRIILLQDTVSGTITEEASCSWNTDTEIVGVFRYQSMENILHEMYALAEGKRVSARWRGTLPKMEVIGVYSPVCHEMQMPFSMVYAAFLSEKQKVLYVNLMEFSGFQQLFELAGEYDLGDLILRIRDGRLSSELFWRSIYETDKVYYIPPFPNPENIKEMKLEDCMAFLDYVETNTDFCAVILDFGQGIGQFARVLERCTCIYCPVKSGFFFECQMKQYTAWLEAEMGHEIMERLHIMDLPFSARRIQSQTGVLRQLQWSEFGDYVRGYLTGAAYERA